VDAARDASRRASTAACHAGDGLEAVEPGTRETLAQWTEASVSILPDGHSVRTHPTRPKGKAPSQGESGRRVAARQWHPEADRDAHPSRARR